MGAPALRSLRSLRPAASRRPIAAGGRSKMPGLRPVTLTKSRQAATVATPPPQPKPSTCAIWKAVKGLSVRDRGNPTACAHPERMRRLQGRKGWTPGEGPGASAM